MASKDPIVVLFNYGGGIRGLVPARIMAEIEKATGYAMADMVDVFCGPSTGAILNAALNVPNPEDPKRPKFTAEDMVHFYEREGAKIFPADRFREFRGFIHDFNNRTMRIGQLNNLFKHGHYDTKHLSVCMRALYGNTCLSESLKSLVVPVYNIDGEQLAAVKESGEDESSPVHTSNNFIDEGGHAVWLKNIKIDHALSTAPHVKLFDAVMASTSAPTYFPCHHFNVEYPDLPYPVHYSGIDGSIFDNPCVSYHGAVRRHIPVDRDVIMIVLGTGVAVRSITKDQWNSYGGLGVVDPVNDLPLINILFHASESALVESFKSELGSDLHVFNKSLIADLEHPDAPNLAIDDASPENLRRLKAFAEEMIEDNETAFDSVCHLLSQHAKQNDGKRLLGYIQIIEYSYSHLRIRK